MGRSVSFGEGDDDEEVDERELVVVEFCSLRTSSRLTSASEDVYELSESSKCSVNLEVIHGMVVVCCGFRSTNGGQMWFHVSVSQRKLAFDGHARG